MSNVRVPKPLPVDLTQALEAICTYGHGRCWYCDVKLPPAERAIRAGWDVQRIEAAPVASIILVCPKCARRKAKLGDQEFERRLTPSHSADSTQANPATSTRRLRIAPGLVGVRS